MTSFRYEWGVRENKAKSKELGRPFYEPCINARFSKIGGDIVIPADTKAFEETYLTVKFPGDKDHVNNVRTLKESLDEFKKNGERPVDGTPITQWPMISMAEAENLRVAGVQSIEALSEIPDDKLRDVGVSRELRNKAREWLDYAADVGAAVSKSSDRVKEIEELKDENSQLKARIRDLEGKLLDEPKKAVKK